jgi:hypothetical protein
MKIGTHEGRALLVYKNELLFRGLARVLTRRLGVETVRAFRPDATPLHRVCVSR